MIDTHCHLDVDAFAPDRREVVARARAAGIDAIIVPAIRPAHWPQTMSVTNLGAEHNLTLGFALGVHPQVITELTEDERPAEDALATIQHTAATNPALCAIGETGLDGQSPEPEAQEHWLRLQLRLARQLQLPVLLHVRHAHDRAVRILREERVWECGGVMHSYGGSAELVPTYVELGLYISFAGAITYPRARKPILAARAVPAERLLIETDGPDQTPEPHRGERNEPAFLAATAAAVATARDQDLADIVAITSANARRLFSRLWRPTVAG